MVTCKAFVGGRFCHFLVEINWRNEDCRARGQAADERRNGGGAKGELGVMRIGEREKGNTEKGWIGGRERRNRKEKE